MSYLSRLFSPENLPSIVLAIAGISGIVVAIRTLNVIKRQTDAAESAANAAKLNAEALINAERVWIMIELQPVPGMGGVMDVEEVAKHIVDVISHTTSFNVRLICKNDGRTPAWITEKRACIDVVDSLPDTPNWDAVGIIQTEPEPLAVGEVGEPTDKSLTCNKARDPGKITVVYGIVRYRDVFAPDRATTFAYTIRVDGRLERLAGYPEYNKNT
jgi:hypothetical protein